LQIYLLVTISKADAENDSQGREAAQRTLDYQALCRQQSHSLFFMSFSFTTRADKLRAMSSTTLNQTHRGACDEGMVKDGYATSLLARRSCLFFP
jgi:hypothetical protein